MTTVVRKKNTRPYASLIKRYSLCKPAGHSYFANAMTGWQLVPVASR